MALKKIKIFAFTVTFTQEFYSRNFFTIILINLNKKIYTLNMFQYFHVLKIIPCYMLNSNNQNNNIMTD